MIYSSRGDFMKKDNDKLAYYLPIMISLGVVFGICFDNIGIGICLGVGAAGILSLFSIKKLDNRNQVKIKKISMIFHGFYCTLKIPEEKALFFQGGLGV